MTEQEPRSFTHVGLTVSDIDAAMEWYADVFDFEVLIEPSEVERGSGLRWRRSVNLFGVEYESVKIGHLSTGNGVGIELFEFGATEGKTDAPPSEPGVFHFGVEDTDLESLAQRIDESGGDHYSDVWDLAASGAQVTYCRDPWGNRIEIYMMSHERICRAAETEAD
jgi:catechol 2,3-dioxygenase-like lactoylglutathione lyase family enzyme